VSTAARLHSANYTPVGTALEAFYAKDGEVLLSGPAGTGKSRAILEKLFLMAHRRYPGMRALIVRKTRESLTQTGLFTWEQFVLPETHPARQGPQRSHRQVYHFPNGSEIVVGGMDKPQKIMSSEYDFIYSQEAIELTEEDWESLTTRLRNGRVPYQQIMADTNPSHPRHWLKLRCDAGRCRLIQTRHEDNPVLHDGTGWTPFGETYLARLDNLTGARKLRLRYGRWVQAEGAIYEDWDANVHVVNPFPIPADWPRYWVIDFGFTNPFVCQWWAKDPDGRVYLYREIYRTKTLVEDHAREVARLMGWTWDEGKKRWDKSKATEPDPERVICDHDAEDRATLLRHLGVTTKAADKAVTAGIQEVQERLKVAADGKPRLFVFRGACLNPDRELVESAKPYCTEHEFDGYIWDVNKSAKECPVKQDDHGMDGVRYLCKHLARPPAVITWG